VTSQLGHPHIVQVFDFGEAPTGEPYLVMEFLEGEDLEKRLARVGRMSAPAASHIIRQVASALSATHAKGIVHRDLKPANVFLLSVEGETDFVKVVDFGISKVRAAGTKLTAAMAVMGTPNYMAPEQAEGRIDEIDHRTDQWALACIAYELVAGRPPFVGENVASLLYQVIHQAPSPLATMNPALPTEVEDVLRRALSKTQIGRFATMTEFSRAFEGAATGKAPVVAAPPEGNAAIARAPTMVSSPGVPPVTTFSSAAGESIAPGQITSSVAPKRRWLLTGVGVAVAAAAGAAGFAFLSRGPGAMAPIGATPAATSTAAVGNVAPAAPSPAAGVDRAAPVRDGGAAQAAAAPPPAAGPSPTKKNRRSSRGSTAAPAVAADTAPPPEVAADAPPEPPPPPAPPPRAAAAPAPAWPPPAWPPPNTAPSQQQKRPNILKRMFR
jgi:serine/threonine-protein kinase